MKALWKGLFWAACCGVWLTALAAADPAQVHLTSRSDFEQAKIEPVREWNEALEGLHPGQRESFRPAQLFVLDTLVTAEGDTDPHPGLLMAWGSPEDSGEIIAAWDLILPKDPDLTGHCITLTAWPRTGMTSISFSLRDAFGVMKGWSWPVGPGPGQLPPNVPTTVTVAASGGPGQAGSTGFWDGGIDLTQVVSFEFDESGVAQGGIPLPNNLGGFVGQWNYWHDILVFPCPAAGVDHYSCYPVDERSSLPPISLSLVDQFTAEDGVRLGKAREICVPVDKNKEGINQPEVHLVCYDVFSRQRVDRLVAVRNQFGEQKLRVKRKIERLCVPSLKKVLK